MGLSDEERIKNIINTVNYLTNIDLFKENANEKIWKEFNEILKDLWFDVVGNTSNGIHWFAGSSSDDNKLSQSNLFGLAILQSYSSDEPEGKSLSEIINQDVDNIFGKGNKKWFDYTNKFKPTALSLLKKDNDEEYKVYYIFKLTESYFYSANRYNDTLSESFINLTKKISRLQGLCFKAMNDNVIYFKAYAAEIVLDKVLSNHIDDINEWFMNESMHHDIRLDLIDKKDLFQAFKKAQLICHDVNGLKFSSQERLVLILKFAGRRFHYVHLHKKLFDLIEKHNVNFKNDLISLKEIKKLFDLAIKNKEVNDSQNDPFWNCDLTNQSNYDLEKLNKKVKK